MTRIERVAIITLLGDNDDACSERHEMLTPCERDALYGLVFGEGFAARKRRTPRMCRHCRAWVPAELDHAV